MESSPPPSEPPPTPAESVPGSVGLAAAVALFAWVGAAWSAYDQKHKADELIGGFDISAIQVQQLSGQVTVHVLVAAVMAMALTIPLLLAVAFHSLKRR